MCEMINLRITLELPKTLSGRHLEQQCSSPECLAEVAERGGVPEQTGD